jgi:dTDP-glucose 4,6-dehydratase
MHVLITGGAGFIGTALCRHLLENTDATITVFDKLTYAANTAAMSELAEDERYAFIRGDICNYWEIYSALCKVKPTAIMNLAAESHVDRSIRNASDFIETNVKGTMFLLEAARKYLAPLDRALAPTFRLLHVSTDEVFGDLDAPGIFDENSAYNPSSPYAASKASSDHLVRAWSRTYQIPAIITNCTNNYGPAQFPEKLIPLICRNAMNQRPLPIYGDGSQMRDWIHVDDHARALFMVLENGTPGETYAIGARNEYRNLDLVRLICRIFDELVPKNAPHERLMEFVTDRPGHDKRYAIDPQKIENTIGWRAAVDFEDGLRETVRWYVENADWLSNEPQGSKAHPLATRASA